MAECNDPKCAVHGHIKVRGNVYTGKVIRAKAAKTVLVERKGAKYVRKFERYKKVRSRIFAHKPECMDINVGDVVRIGETRKLSKTKSFVVLGKVEKAVEGESK